MMSRTLPLLLLLLVVARIVRVDAASGAHQNVTDGPHSCGGVDVPYPFGIAYGDGRDNFRSGFAVGCEAGKPVLTTDGAKISFAIGNFSIERAEARVWLPVGWQCYNSSGQAYDWDITTLEISNGGVYRISNAKNYLFVLGCFTMGYLRSQPDRASDSYTQLTGCLCYCNNSQSAVNGVCSGVGCCHADVPPDLVDNSVGFDSYNHTDKLSFSSCDYAFLAEKDYYTFHTADLKRDLRQSPQSMPVMLDWSIRDSSTCEEAKKKDGYACISSNSICLNSTNGPGYICKCSDGYEGNPYISDGCTDINECDYPDNYTCGGICKNIEGFYKCTCDKHSHSVDPFKVQCMPNFTQKQKITIGVTIGVTVGVFIMVILVFLWILAKEKRKMKELFEKNGGPTLEKLNNIKLFTKDDIRKIRKASKYIGKGAFGSVYCGHIKDSNQVVAVKEPINGTSADKGQFVNEIIIQSQSYPQEHCQARRMLLRS